MFERPAGGGRALVVALDFGNADPDYRVAEITALAESAGALVVGIVRGSARGLGKRACHSQPILPGACCLFCGPACSDALQQGSPGRSGERPTSMGRIGQETQVFVLFRSRSGSCRIVVVVKYTLTSIRPAPRFLTHCSVGDPAWA